MLALRSFPRPFVGPILPCRSNFSSANKGTKVKEVFDKSAPRVLDSEFQRSTSQLVQSQNSFSDLTLLQRQAVGAFVSYDTKMQEQAQKLFTSKKPVDTYSDEEKKVAELQTNFDQQFRDSLLKALWKNCPSDEVDPIRSHFANFDYGLKALAKKKIGFAFSTESDYEERLFFIFVNYNADFVRKAKVLMEQSEPLQHGFSKFERLDEKDRTHLKVYINLNKEFINKAKSLMRRLQSVEKLTDSEIMFLKLYVNHNTDFRKEMKELFKKPTNFEIECHKKLFNCAFQFDIFFKAKIQRLMKGTQQLNDLLPEEQHLLSWYVNCSDDFGDRLKLLLSSVKECQNFSTEEKWIAHLFTNLDIQYQSKVTDLVNDHQKKGGFHDTDEMLRYPNNNFFPRPKPTPTKDFTFEEERCVKFYVNFHLGYKNSLQKFLQSELPFTDETRRLFALTMWYNLSFREKVFSAIWDEEGAAKIVRGPQEAVSSWSKSPQLDRARREWREKSDDEWRYYILGDRYYNIPIDMG